MGFLKDLFDILGGLEKTPVPSVLVVAGLIFLLLSLAGKLAGQIEIPPSRQMMAGILGGLFLISGVFLYILPAVFSATITPTATALPAVAAAKEVPSEIISTNPDSQTTTHPPTTEPTSEPTLEPSPTSVPSSTPVPTPEYASIEEHISFPQNAVSVFKRIRLRSGMYVRYELFVLAGQTIIVRTSQVIVAGNLHITITDGNGTVLGDQENTITAHAPLSAYYYINLTGSGEYEVEVYIPPPAP